MNRNTRMQQKNTKRIAVQIPRECYSGGLNDKQTTARSDGGELSFFVSSLASLWIIATATVHNATVYVEVETAHFTRNDLLEFRTMLQMFERAL